MEKKNYVISEDLANAILNYLVSRPYREVDSFVKGLLSLHEVPLGEVSE